ncbi:MAG: tetratricopeptide repeat protein [Candidatus Manganitrophus sp.]|nr:tetratricopeptide repeat protein [Candidatus Manganitrophus sp.]
MGSWARKREAVEMLKRAVSLRPYYPEAHFNLGVTYIGLKNQAAALEEYKILSDINRKRAERLFGLIYA